MWLEQFQQQCASINQCHTRLMSLRMRSEASLKAELDKILTLTTTSRATTTPSSTTTTDTSNNELERLLLPSSNDNGSDVPEDVVTDEVLAGCYPHVPEAYRRVLYLLQKGMHSMFIYVRVPHSTILVTILIYIYNMYLFSGPLWAMATIQRDATKGQNYHLLTYLLTAISYITIYTCAIIVYRLLVPAPLLSTVVRVEALVWVSFHLTYPRPKATNYSRVCILYMYVCVF